MKNLLLCLPASLLFLSSYSLDPDLKLKDGSVSVHYDFQTALITEITYTVENAGDFSAGTVVNEVYLVDIGTGKWKLATMESTDNILWAGESEDFKLTNIDLDAIPGLKTGTYYIRIEIDVFNDEDESDEANNNVTLTGAGIQFESLVSVSQDEIVKKLKVFPNPTTGDQLNLQFELTSQEEILVEIFSVVGTKMISENLGDLSVQNQLISIDITRLPPGTYFLSATFGRNRKTISFIRQ